MSIFRDDDKWKDFCHRVGWRIKWKRDLGWLKNSELTFDLKEAPVGHLPSSPRHAPAFGVHREDSYVGVYTLLPYLCPYFEPEKAKQDLVEYFKDVISKQKKLNN